MKQIWKKWNSISLVKRIICGMLIGAILGVVVPQATGLSILGDLFVGALKAVAPILVFVLVISALAHAKSGKSGNMKMVIFLYLLGTFLAAAVAVVASFIFPVTLTLAEAAGDTAAPSGILEVLKSLLLNIVSNPVSALVNANFIGILTWAIILGVALRAASETTKDILEDLAEAVSKAVRWVISLAPIGILGLVFTTVSTNGLEIFTEYGILLLLLVGCMLFVALVVNPIMVYCCTHKNPYPLVWRCLKESGITAFFTRSSAANIPVNMELCEKLELDEDCYSVSIPLGSTINMAGASVTITVMALAAVHTLGISVDIPTAIILSILAGGFCLRRFRCGRRFAAADSAGMFSVRNSE